MGKHIDVPSVAVDDKTEPQDIKEDINQQLPLDIEPQEPIIDEGIIITPEKENDELNSDSQGANSENKFTFVDTVEEIRKLNYHGLNYAQIAKKLTDANYPTIVSLNELCKCDRDIKYNSCGNIYQLISDG